MPKGDLLFYGYHKGVAIDKYLSVCLFNFILQKKPLLTIKRGLTAFKELGGDFILKAVSLKLKELFL